MWIVWLCVAAVAWAGCVLCIDRLVNREERRRAAVAGSMRAWLT